jgi:uncharacterized protein
MPDASQEIQIYEIKRMDLKGSTIINGFPGVGLVSSIVANYLVNSLKLEQIGLMDSNMFPTVSLIRNSEPHHPVRIYAGTSPGKPSDNLVVFISEFQPPQSIVKPIAETLIDWAQDQWCSLIMCPEGLVIEKEEGATPDDEEKAVRVYGVGSTLRARELIIEPNVLPFSEGVITGVAGILLNEGKRRNFDVISLLAEAQQDYPDARAAAKIIEIIDRLMLHTRLDAKPLYREAERIEAQIRAVQSKATIEPKASSPTSSMYG